MIDRLKRLLHISTPQKLSVHEKIDNLYLNLGEDIITLNIGSDLSKFDNNICELIENVRNELYEETGFILPLVHVTEQDTLQENEYLIRLYGRKACSGYAVPNILGLDEIADKLKELAFINIKELLTNENVEKYINTVQKNNGWLIYSLCTKISPLEIKIILGDLLEKGCSVKNINYIFEKIGNKVLVEHDWYNFNPHKISDEIFKEL